MRCTLPLHAHGLKSSDVEPGVLEIEVTLDEVHHVVVDPSHAPELDDRSPLGVEKLAAKSLVVLRLLLDGAVVLLVETGRETVPAEAVQAAHSLGGVVAHPVLARELIEARDCRVGGEDARLRLLFSCTPVV